jgi:hypothetical protein
MKRRARALLSTTVLLVALGCGGKSNTTFNETPGTGASSGAGSGGTGGSGGSTVTGGSAGAPAGGGGVAGGATSGGSAGTTALGGSAGGGAPGGTGGASGAGTGGNAGGSSIAGSAGSAGMPAAVQIGGVWGMFWFEDPVAVSIRQVGSMLTGTGCCAGLGSGDSTCCGPLAGTCEDGRADFSFDMQDAGVIYGTSVYVSENGERMGGTFHVDGGGSLAVGWVRLTEPSNHLGNVPSPLREVLQPRTRGWGLELKSAAAGRFDPDTNYQVVLGGPGYVWSDDFGAFWWGEMTWDEATQTLTVGPVPATDPSFATKLELVFDGTILVELRATYPDEPLYVFSAYAEGI